MDGNTDTTLKPCPFCGSEPAIRRGGRYGFWALCQHCGAALRMSDTEEDAANAWNRRAAKREDGDAAAMREALNQLRDWALLDINENAIRSDETNYQKLVDGIVEITNTALSAPARNCDRYGDEDDAFAAWHDALNDGDVVSVRNAFAWLFAKAEGGAE